MESHPQNPEFTTNPENFHACILTCGQQCYVIAMTFDLNSDHQGSSEA